MKFVQQEVLVIGRIPDVYNVVKFSFSPIPNLLQILFYMLSDCNVAKH